MHYELWDTASGNLIGEYDSEERAVAVLRRACAEQGLAILETLSLGAQLDEDEPEQPLPPVVSGATLIALVNGSDSAPTERRSA